VPKKNLRPLDGFPLVSWATSLALNQSEIDKVILSTDNVQVVNADEFFQEYSEDFKALKPGESVDLGGKRVLHKRREVDATDIARTIDAVTDYFRSNHFDLKTEIYLLQPTSPFRNEIEFSSVIENLSSAPIHSVVSAKEFESPHPGKAIKIQDQLLEYSKELVKMVTSPRQELEKFYVFDGAYYGTKLSHLFRYNSFVCPKTKVFVREGLRTMNIDSEMDFEFAQYAAVKFGFKREVIR
jgi:CMP-N,N'-diacetyllegionaminic acid synthase